MTILETEKLVLREMDAATDAEFIFELLNTPKFIKYIGDRGVRSVEQAAAFIENRYRQSYREHGFGLYTVELKPEYALTNVRVSATASAPVSVGICGFVKRGTLPDPDLGFAFLPDHEGKGYGYESAKAVLEYGRETLGFKRILAITTLDNEASSRLLSKLGFAIYDLMDSPDGEKLRLFSSDL